MDDRLRRIEDKIDALLDKFTALHVVQARQDVSIADLLRRVAEIEDWKRWAMRLILGIIFTAIVSGVIVGARTIGHG